MDLAPATGAKNRLREHSPRVVRLGQRDGAHAMLTACAEDGDWLGWFTRAEMTIEEQQAAKSTVEKP